MKGKVTLTPKMSETSNGWYLSELTMTIDIATGDRHRYETCYQGELLSVKARATALASGFPGYVHPLNIEKKGMVPLPRNEEEIDIPDDLIALVNDFEDRRKQLEKALISYMLGKWEKVEPELEQASKLEGVKPLDTAFYPVILTK